MARSVNEAAYTPLDSHASSPLVYMKVRHIDAVALEQTDRLTLVLHSRIFPMLSHRTRRLLTDGNLASWVAHADKDDELM